MYGGPAGAAVAAGVTTKLLAKHNSWGDALKHAAIAGGTTALGNTVFGPGGVTPGAQGSSGSSNFLSDFASKIPEGVKSFGSKLGNAVNSLNPFSGQAAASAGNIGASVGPSLWEGGVGPAMSGATQAASKGAFDNIDKLLMAGTAF
jgi:hypothetical protein